MRVNQAGEEDPSKVFTRYTRESDGIRHLLSLCEYTGGSSSFADSIITSSSRGEDGALLCTKLRSISTEMLLRVHIYIQRHSNRFSLCVLGSFRATIHAFILVREETRTLLRPIHERYPGEKSL